MSGTRRTRASIYDEPDDAGGNVLKLAIAAVVGGAAVCAIAAGGYAIARVAGRKRRGGRCDDGRCGRDAKPASPYVFALAPGDGVAFAFALPRAINRCLLAGTAVALYGTVVARIPGAAPAYSVRWHALRDARGACAALERLTPDDNDSIAFNTAFFGVDGVAPSFYGPGVVPAVVPETRLRLLAPRARPVPVAPDPSDASDVPGFAP